MKTRKRKLTEKESLNFGEFQHFKTLLDLYPTGILSVVSDTWDLWKVCTEYLPRLKEQIITRDGKLVIRPDSGDPVDILCGFENPDGLYHRNREITERDKLEAKGVIELLWDVFGGTINGKGYKVLDPHIGAIYGDSITMDRAIQICDRLKAKGFASTNVVYGIGSYTYQYNTRDTFGFAMKATYGEVGGVGRNIFKDPITDDGTKRSAKGLLMVHKGSVGLELIQECDKDIESGGELRTIFLNGVLTVDESLETIRARVNGNA